MTTLANLAFSFFLLNNLTGDKISIEITRHFKIDLSDAFERVFHGL